jgi:PhoH-like ATPase
MKKVFVLDTNVLLHDPMAMFRFEDNDVILPITIIEELDRFKKGTADTGRNARYVSRTLDDLRKRVFGTGHSPGTWWHFKVALCHRDTLMQQLLPSWKATRATTPSWPWPWSSSTTIDLPVVLVSKDTNLRIKADALGLVAEDYETDKIDIDDLYTGTMEKLTRQSLSINCLAMGICSQYAPVPQPGHYPGG